ncbi:MAG: substrate-binding domain-containing protein [Clostridia bacterium]|nr:substrate-binding domain-containing protein [Clostridia bacterium]
MDYVLKTSPVTKERLTIGFLDDNIYDDFHSQLMMGIAEAAKKYNINIIRFGYYSSQIAYKFTQQVDMILQHIEQFELDGLLFLGWAKAGPYYNYESFTTRFHHLPLLSIGSGIENIPSVYFPGDLFVREMLLHLIHKHHAKKIAYISPYRPDRRYDAYQKTMQEHGLFSPELVVTKEELEGLSLAERARKAVAILLDERNADPDAIVSLYNAETESLLKELSARNIDVPGDLAVVSYEDGEFGKFSSPGITTVYYPWMELGYNGCEKMVELLRHGRIPQNTIVPGRVIYRDSCGCLPSAGDFAGEVKLQEANQSLINISQRDRDEIIKEMIKAYPYSSISFEILLDAFIRDYREGSGVFFLSALSQQLKNVSSSFNYTNLEDIISVFRRLVLPYVLCEDDALLWAGDLLQQAQVLVREKVANTRVLEKVVEKIMFQTLQVISKEIVSKFNKESLLELLVQGLPKLSIPRSYIYLFDPAEGNQEKIFERCALEFCYCNNRRIHTENTGWSSAKQLILEMQRSQEKSYIFFSHMLYVNGEFLGLALFEPGPMGERVYHVLSAYISTALSGSILLEKLDSSYKKLVAQAHREGMADVAIEIIHNIGNLLNSINASAVLMEELTKAPSFDDFSRANRLLAEQINDFDNFLCSDPRGKKLLQFYLKLGDSFIALKSQLFTQVNRLGDKINSVGEMITSQQNYAGVNLALEELDLVGTLEDAIRLLSESLEKFGIKIERKYESTPKVLAQRIKLFHILINVINNAKEAMSKTPMSERVLTLMVYEDPYGKFVSIKDRGCGIPVTELEAIFSYGYTTKKDGHGFGLHSCMSYMNEIGGSIWAESDGYGKGATFMIRFST